MADIAKLTVGREEYYTRELATDHEAYLSGHGESPGRWYGAGANGLGLEGEAASAIQSLLMEVPLHRRCRQAVGGLQVSGRDHDRWLADDPVASVQASPSLDSACTLSRVRAFSA